MELILASQSPRRHEIMDFMGLSYQTVVCTEPDAGGNKANILIILLQDGKPGIDRMFASLHTL